VIDMTDEERDEILRTARANIAARDKTAEQQEILRASLAVPCRDFRERGSRPVPKLRRADKIDTLHVHPRIGLHDIDQRIERALEAERESILEIVRGMTAFADAVEATNRQLREEFSELKVECARLTSVAEELRRALDNERARTASGELLPRRLHAH
jgi:hypothetical protein